MLLRNDRAIFILISYFLLISRTNSRTEENKPDSYSLKSDQDASGLRSVEFDDEFKEFEDKLKRLRQRLAEEKKKPQPTTTLPTIQEQPNAVQPVSQPQQPPSHLQNGSEQKSTPLWFKSTQNHTEAATNHLETKISDIIELFNPSNFIPSPSDLLKPLKALTAATQHFIPEPFRFTGDMRKTTEMFSNLLSRDMPQLLQRMPESLEGMIRSLNNMRKNGTESARNETIGLFNKISRNLFVWSALMAQTDLMATLSLSLMSRAFIHVLKATPLPTEVMKLQTALNSMTLHLSQTLPITITILSSGPFGNLTNDLEQLVKNIDEMNKAMDALQNQTNIVQQIMDRTPTTSTIFDKQTLEQFQSSMVDLVETIERMLQSIPLATSLLLGKGEYLMEFLGDLSQTFIESGVIWKMPANIQNIQKRFQQIFNLKQFMPFLNSSNPIGKASINLLTRLQSLFLAMHSSLFTPTAMISTQTLIVSIDGCIDAIRVLTSVNPYLPSYLLQPLLISLELMSKFLKYGTIKNQ